MAASALIGFVAGEPSGDLLAAPVVAALRARENGLQVAGIAGDLMQAAGCSAWWHVRELSVRGYVEVLRVLPRLIKMRRDLRRRLIAAAPQVVVGVDAPDFNLGLEIDLRRAGIPIVHYVSPSIWAWRARKIEVVRRAANRVLLVFPFEQAIYDRAGIPATYVGHPLASGIPFEVDAGRARQGLGMPADARVVAVLPGSRPAEIEYLGPAFFGAIELLAREDACLRFVLPAASAGLRQRIEQLAQRAPRAAERLTILDGRAHDALAAADAVLVASGTATLEAALFKRPMVIAYRMPAVSAWLTRRQAHSRWVGLPNLLLQDSVVPELLQEDATPARLAATVTAQLADEAGRRRLVARFGALHRELARDTAALASQAILDVARAGARA
jgi:lipid-A-disaccharide synthase